MRSASGVLSGMSVQRAKPFWTHVTAYKLQKSLAIGNFRANIAAEGDPGGMQGEGCQRTGAGGVQRGHFLAILDF